MQAQAGPQAVLINCPVQEIFFGGARGGGKTFGVLLKLAHKAKAYGGHYNAVIFRKELPSLDDAIEASHQVFSGLAKWQDQKKTWRFVSGARIRFRPLENLNDAGKYQGQNLTDIVVEEAGEYPDPAPIFRLWGALRSAHGIPTQFILTGNPGGPGHQWLKDRYVAPHPNGMKILEESFDDGFGNSRVMQRIFIPSKVTDNQILLQRDPNYVVAIKKTGSEALVKAWLHGSWDEVQGAFFDCFGGQHIVNPFPIPDHWLKFRSMDWGSAAPFAVGWWTLVEDECALPKNSLVMFREWYGAKKSATGAYEGLKMTAEEVAQGIQQRTFEEIEYSVIDPSAFKQDGGPSIAERMWNQGVRFRRADNKRIGTEDGKGPIGGWDQVRARLLGDTGKPLLYFVRDCQHTIRTLPSLRHDINRPEDLDTAAEDHCADMVRYACMSRPHVRTPPPKTIPAGYIFDTGIKHKRDDFWTTK